MRKKQQPAQIVEPTEDGIKAAIAAGKALIDEGKTKAEAAMAIFLLIENASQETVVKAFVEGATLTERGALTYWYNCRKKVKKQRLVGEIAPAAVSQKGDK